MIQVPPGSGVTTHSAFPILSDTPAVREAASAVLQMTADPDFPISVGTFPGLSPLPASVNHLVGLKN